MGSENMGVLRVKNLKISFKKYGQVFTQILRSSNKAIYEVKFNEKVIGYEVVKIKFYEAKKLIVACEARTKVPYEGDYSNYDQIESYPGDESFGSFGWYFMADGKERAIKKYEELPEWEKPH